MTPQEWQRVRPILESALELDRDQRSSYLDHECSDPSLRRELDSLICAHERADTGVLNGIPAMAFVDEDEARFRLVCGKSVGPYEILEQIAVGGMGAVYRAVRADGQYKQQVALKIVRADPGAEATIARFRNERQILASLDHPNIAKILDGGTTIDGLPYFVMEFVDGLTITGYCDQHKLSIDERLQIFRTVCAAVHYAHQRLVIHRDLKPTNILVTAEGIPKLLDFGIAKILDPGLFSEALNVTATGTWMMTPEYASPEQLRGDPMDTASDVYSLGLILYELLTGRRAYRFPSYMPHEVARVVLETDPEKPSNVVRHMENGEAERTAPSHRLAISLASESPEKLRKRLAGDLDNIVLKAIRKEPRARYASVDQLSEDVGRHLEGLPVLARQSTVAYRCRKYVLRHKIGVTAAALVLLSLLTGLTLTLREAHIARANELRAERRFNDVRSLANSLIFEINDSIRDLPGSTPARKLLVDRALQYLDSLSAESGKDYALKRELASAYVRLGDVQGYVYRANLGDTAGAMRSYEKAMAIREALARDHPNDRNVQADLASSYLKMADMFSFLGENARAMEKSRDALAIRELLAASDPNSETAAWDLAEIHRARADEFMEIPDWLAAEKEIKHALAGFEALSTGHPDKAEYRRMTAISHAKLGFVYEGTGEITKAQQEYRQEKDILQQLVATDPNNALLRRNLAMAHLYLGDVLIRLGDTLGFKEMLEGGKIAESIASRDPADRRIDRDISFIYAHLGDAERKLGTPTRALHYYARSLEVAKKRAAADPYNADAAEAVANRYQSMGTLYQTMAEDNARRASERRLLWQNANSCFQKALDFWLDANKRTQLTRSNNQTVQDLQQRLRESDAALKTLDSPAVR